MELPSRYWEIGIEDLEEYELERYEEYLKEKHDQEEELPFE